MEISKPHWIVTGGAGFIGSHLCDALIQSGAVVTAWDNLLTGRKENLKELHGRADFFFLKADVCTAPPPEKIPFLKTHGLEGILHFACPASPVDFDRIPIEILKVDSLGTIFCSELALQYKARFVLASTSEVYGDPLIHPQKEDYWGNVNPVGPRACYDETKRFAEAYVSTLNRFKKLNAGIVRIFNTYGPRMRLNDGRVVPEFCAQAIAGEALSIHGDGRQTRSFCYVSDLVSGILKYAKSSVTEPVNLGNPEEISILQFAEKVIRAREKIIPLHQKPSPIAIKYTQARTDDPKLRRPDISKAQQLLGWRPEISLELGLERSFLYFLAEFKSQIKLD